MRLGGVDHRMNVEKSKTLFSEEGRSVGKEERS